VIWQAWSRRQAALLVGLALVASLSACTGVSYLWQGARGQMDLLARARPIAALLDDADTPAPLRDKLVLARDLRAFAVRELTLPDNGSYSRYSELGRTYVLWNVIATPALSLKPAVSCFPVAGCVAYRGYFAREDAEAFAAAQREAGFDVFIAGVPAYSTLGWFDDPLPSTVLHYSELELARLLFHELAHQVVYVADDTTFNESFAVAVEEEGLERWVAQRQDWQLEERLARGKVYRSGFRELVTRTRARLAEVYAGDQAQADQLAAKARILGQMQVEYRDLRESWGGFTGYDAWFARAQNNASLASVALYADQVPRFRELLKACGKDLPRFYAAVRAWGADRDARSAGHGCLCPTR
jgi:predicted aminopeptidase